MPTEYELVVLQQDDSSSTAVMRELASLGSGFTLVQLNEPSVDDPALVRVFTALARNQAAQRADASWVVFLDSRIDLHGRWLDQLRADLEEADAAGAVISVANDSAADAGRRNDIAYRRDFLERCGGFPVGIEVAGQEDLLLGVQCLVEDRPILAGRRRSGASRDVRS
jgi:hypothetical protein